MSCAITAGDCAACSSSFSRPSACSRAFVIHRNRALLMSWAPGGQARIVAPSSLRAISNTSSLPSHSARSSSTRRGCDPVRLPLPGGDEGAEAAGHVRGPGGGADLVALVLRHQAKLRESHLGVVALPFDLEDQIVTGP